MGMATQLFRKIIIKPFNSIRFFGINHRCEICGYPKEMGRPYEYIYDKIKKDYVLTPSYFYQCKCYEKQNKNST